MQDYIEELLETTRPQTEEDDHYGFEDYCEV